MNRIPENFQNRRIGSALLKITNNFPEHYIAFKVKTTDPKDYVVKPNMSHIKPGMSSEINIFALQHDPLKNPKFMIKVVRLLPY